MHKLKEKKIFTILCSTVCLGFFIFSEDTHPEVMFSRHSRLAFTEITSYKADPSLKWLAITGLTPEVDVKLQYYKNLS